MNTKMLGHRVTFGLVFALVSALTANAEDQAIARLLADMRAVIERQEQQIERLEQRVEELERRAPVQQIAPQAATQPRAAAPVAAAPAAVPASTPATGPKPVLSRFGLTLYGYVKLDAAYDTHKTSAGNLAFHVLPKQGLGDDDEFHLTAKQTRLGLRLTGPAFGAWQTRGLVEMDFYGSASENGASPRMRLAYLQLENDSWRLQAGQDWDLWQNVAPKTVNFATMGHHGSVWSRRPSAFAVRKIALGADSRMEVGAGIARTIGHDLDGGGQEDGKDSGKPQIQWTIVYHTMLAHGMARFGIGGHYGWETLDLNGVDSKSFDTSLVVGSFHLPIANKLSMLGMIWTGRNLLNVYGGIGQGINLSKDREIRATGGWLQLAWKPRPAWEWTVFHGIDDPRNADLNQGQRARNKTLGTNVFWSATPAVTLAFEYQFMETKYLDTETADSHRLQSAVIFAF